MSTTSPLTRFEADARRRRRDQRGVVPRQLRQRLRQFLQPGVVREAAVVDARIGTEHDFEPAGSRCRRRAERRQPAASPSSARTRVFGITPSCSHCRQSRSNGESRSARPHGSGAQRAPAARGVRRGTASAAGDSGARDAFWPLQYERTMS